MGSYQLLREIAKGPLGPLYELRSADSATKLSGIGRLVVLPGNLAPEVEQTIAESAWESMELRYDLALCVADVVFGKGWITLVHDHFEGTLLRSLQRRAHERQSAFPVAVALRVVTDVLDGLAQNRSACDAAGITWCPGSAASTSLYLCGDGRTRALDGRVLTALTQAAPLRTRVASVGFPAPETLESGQQPDERADVFTAATVLWELLTGRELALGEAAALGQRPRPKVPNLNLSVPKGTTISANLVKVVQAALELSPAKRPSTVAELRAALSEVGDVASYEKVIDFTDALLNRESTLFRLTLDAGPKLSDEMQSERPKPNHLEWATELAKRARVTEAQKTTRTAPAVVVRSPHTAAAPPKPRESLGPRATEAGPMASKPLANKTLIGMAEGRSLAVSAPAAQKAATARPTDFEPAAHKPVRDMTLIGMAVPPTSLEPSRPTPEPELGRAAVASPPPPELGARSEPIASLIAQALPAPGVGQRPAPTHTRSVAASPLSLDSALGPIVASVATTARTPQVPRTDTKRAIALTLPTIALGLVINTVLAVMGTLLFQRLFLPAPATSLRVSAQPKASTVSTGVTAPTPESSTTASPSMAIAAAAETKPNSAPAHDLATAAPVAPVAPTPVVPKPVPRKPRRQYVPNEL